jgi:hypothetical protein
MAVMCCCDDHSGTCFRQIIRNGGKQHGGIQMKYIHIPSLLPLFFAFTGHTTAAERSCLVSPPTKEIRIKNNSPETIFPVIGVPLYDKSLPPPAKSADLWMQAQCGISDQDAEKRRFTTSKVYRAYINLQGDVATTGVPPGSTVKIMVPFYTRALSGHIAA